MNLRLNLCLSLYKYLANAYPHEFRIVYGQDLDRLAEDAVPEAWRRYGLLGLVRLLADIAIRLPGEYLGEIRQDVVYALRVLARSPGFAAVAILSLALGIAMCSAILFGSSSVLRPMPGARDPGALVAARKGVSYPYFEHYRDHPQVAGAATVFLVSVPFAVAPGGGRNARAERFYGHIVSPEYFATLGVTPAAGRFFARETERPGMVPVVVVTDRFWRSYLNSDPRAVGRVVRLNGQLATIVGIAPPDFLGMWPFNPADLFVPVTCGSALAPELAGDPLHARDLEMFRMVVRLPHGVGIPAAEAALDAMTLALDRQAPDADRDRDPKSRQLRLMPAGTFGLTTPEQRAFVYSFNFVMWVLILSLVCANLANLLLARGSQRRREIALRLSVGASRARLVRQFLTESVLLSLAGGVAGIVAAFWVAHMMTALPLPSSGPLSADFRPDLRIFALTLAASLAAGIGCGLAPALASVRADIGLALKEGGLAGSHGYRRFSLRNLFVVAQVAASLMLLLVTGFIVTGYGNVSRIDPGFDTNNLDMFSLDPVRDGYSAREAETLFAKLPEQLSRVSGVRALALAGSAPFGSLLVHTQHGRLSALPRDGDGRPVWCQGYSERIGANYFATLGVPLVSGHEFDIRDQQSDAPPGTATPAVINQSAARALFGGENPIGRLIHEDAASYTVIGVTHDVRSGWLPAIPVPTVFLPLTAGGLARSRTPTATVLVRVAGGTAPLAAVRDAMASLHPDLTIFNVQTMRENLDRINAFAEWSTAVYFVLGLFSLLLASIGLGGVTAYAVAQRRKEIGIRMALGARGRQVQGLVMREGTALVVVGSICGLGGAMALRRAFSALSESLAKGFAQPPLDYSLLAGAPLLLAALALAACYLPARRATRIDPVAALREE
ncbi:MAG: ADOP family duplicated permease [Candidatus Solibacter sp.]|jgi:predicted permease